MFFEVEKSIQNVGGNDFWVLDCIKGEIDLGTSMRCSLLPDCVQCDQV